jgi:hypothetical protein
MMRRNPSVQTLRAVFADNAPEARRVLTLTHAQLREHPAGDARIAECHHMPAWHDVRLTALDSIGDTFGVESIEFENGARADYLNSGDSYALTLIFWRGNYRVQSVGDFIETMERRGMRAK